MTNDAWTRVATLYDPVNGPNIKDGGVVAGGALVSVTTYAAQLAWSPNTPACVGHPMSDGDSLSGNHKEWIKNLWVRNNTASENTVIVVTPMYNL